MKSMQKRHRIAFQSVLLAFMIGLTFLVAMNIGLKYYIAQQSEIALSHYMDGIQYVYQFDEINPNEDMYNTIEDTTSDLSIFSVYEMPTNISDYYESSEYFPDTFYFNSIELELSNYVNENIDQLELFTVENQNFSGNEIYFSLISFTVSDGYETFIDEFIIYVDTSPVYNISEILNIFFVIVMIISIIGASYFGIKTGKSMENSDEKLRRFFSNASHELKTPLMSIQGYAEGIQKGILPDVKEASNIILEQSERMEALVEELLLLSRLESGQLKLSSSDIDLCELLDSVIAINASSTKQKNIEVTIDFPLNSPHILGDEQQLFKAFNSVFSNSVKFTNNTIAVTVSSQASNAYVIISDNGNGIDETDMPHIFERFYYGAQGSSGIGLSLAQEIIHIHKGNIHAKNNNGAVFTIILPLQ